MLRDGRHVSVEPQAVMRCDMAEALGDWIREDIEPLAQQAGGGLAKVMGADSYVCRGRNRVAGAKMSEHGRGNAFDVTGFSLRNGSTILVGAGNGAGVFVSGLRSSGCARFTTVLGPGSDGFHETHMHVDLAVRSGGHRICQWELKQR